MKRQVDILKYQLWGKRHTACPIKFSQLQPEKFCTNNFVLCFLSLLIWKSLNLEICRVDFNYLMEELMEVLQPHCRLFSPLATFFP